MSLLGCFKAIVEGFALKSDHRPIGLKHFNEYSNDELLNQLSNPIAPPPKFKPTVTKKARVIAAAPAFAYVPQSSYSYESYVEFFRKQQTPQFPRRR